MHRTIALSKDLQSYLEQRVGLDRSRVAQIYNGVDTRRFCPADGGLRVALDASPFNDPSLWVVGAVGRMQTVKDQPLLARAFVEALRNDPEGTRHWRLVM
ncbi:MAG: sugar transferase, partial [bacterium]